MQQPVMAVVAASYQHRRVGSLLSAMALARKGQGAGGVSISPFIYSKQVLKNDFHLVQMSILIENLEPATFRKTQFSSRFFFT